MRMFLILLLGYAVGVGLSLISHSLWILPLSFVIGGALGYVVEALFNRYNLFNPKTESYLSNNNR